MQLRLLVPRQNNETHKDRRSGHGSCKFRELVANFLSEVEKRNQYSQRSGYFISKIPMILLIYSVLYFSSDNLI